MATNYRSVLIEKSLTKNEGRNQNRLGSGTGSVRMVFPTEKTKPIVPFSQKRRTYSLDLVNKQVWAERISPHVRSAAYNVLRGPGWFTSTFQINPTLEFPLLLSLSDESGQNEINTRNEQIKKLIYGLYF